MIWMIILFSIFIFLVWILFAPIHIIIDTTRKIYGAGLIGLITARLVQQQAKKGKEEKN